MISRILTSCTVLFVLFGTALMAQPGTGTLKGTVLDKNTGEPLPFANVVVLSGDQQIGGGATDFDGKYTIKPIPPGSYNIKCAFVGYNPVVISGVIISGDKITFQNLNLVSGVNLEEVIVTEYVQPLIQKDGGASGGTVNREDIDKMAARTATSVATTVGGITGAGQAEGEISVRGARSENTYIYIDGIKVRGTNNLPKASIEEVSVLTGGIPANYGDATGGIISITTRGASSQWFGGVDILSSGFRSGDDIIGLDDYGQTQVEGFLSGPLIFKKDENGEKTEPLMGFFLSGNYRKFEDPRPSVIGHWYLTDEAQAALEADPAFTVQNADGTFGQRLSAELLRLEDFENVSTARNSDETAASLTAKFDINVNKNANLSIGGSGDLRRTNDFLNNGYTTTTSLASIAALGRTNSYLNFGNNPFTERLAWRGFARFTQRFNSAEDSKIKNAFYNLSVDYSRSQQRREDPNHGDNFFNYGYVGQFEREQQLNFGFDDEGNLENNGLQQYFVDYNAGDANPILSAEAGEFFNTLTAAGDTVLLEDAQQSVFNGEVLARPFGLFNNVGTPANYFFRRNNEQFRLVGSGSADIGDHAITLGFEYEQRIDRGFDIAPVGLWERARNIVNQHITTISQDNLLFGEFYAPNSDFTNFYSPAVDLDNETTFSVNLRESLGLDPNYFQVNNINSVEDLQEWYATHLINVDGLSADQMSLDMFSAQDLLQGGANLVDYYGYDHTGEVLTTNPSLNDFFTARDENGSFTRPVDAFRPIYTAAYLMDKFTFDDIIFNVGVRIDRFDANQSVLRDEYIVGEAFTAGNIPGDASNQIRQQLEDRPSVIGDDFAVYVDNIDAPTSVRGFRDGDVWYDANGTQLNNPQQLQVGVASFPYHVKRQDYFPQEGGLDENAFVDYDPVINVMPRVSFSFPISDEAVFFAHYDVLTQRPENGIRLEMLNYLFVQTQNAVINNPALRPTQTIDYELGFQQVLTRSSALKISAFYRDMRDMVQVRLLPSAWPVQYLTYRNIDFGTVKGLTLNYDLRRTGNTRINANYTLQFADGTGSNSTSGINLANAGEPNLQNIAPLNFDQRHLINVTLDYRYGEGTDYNGPVWFGKQVFSNTGLNLISSLGSGTPYSSVKESANILNPRNNGGLDGTINGARLPAIFTINAQLDKNIALKFGGEGEKQKTANLNIYLLVNNLLNTQNVRNVYAFTGSPSDDGFLATEEAAQIINEQEQLGTAAAYQDLYALRLANPFNFGLARTIQLGVKFDF